MKILNRAAVVLRYRQPFLEWAASIVPEDPTGLEESAPLEEFFQAIFEHELEDWCLDPTRWPAQRDFTMLQAWFEVTAVSVVLDLAPAKIRVEEL